MTRASLATVVCVCSLYTALPVAAAPANPSDDDLARAHQALKTGAASVAELAGQVTSAQERLAELELSMGQLREAVNKSLVDLHDAQGTAERARQAAAAAKTELGNSQQELEKAQKTLNEISRTAYRRGASNPMGAISGETTSEDSLDRSTYLRTNAEKQRAAIEALDHARTVTANKESELRQARNLAEQRENEATAAQQSAQAAIEENSQALAESSEKHERLLSEQRWAQAQLDSAKGNASNLLQQREDFEKYQAEEKEKRAKEQARQAEEARKKAEKNASERSAQQQAAAAVAATVQSRQPVHVELDNPYPSEEDAQPAEVADIQNPEAAGGAGESGSSAPSTENEITQEPTLTATPETESGTDDTGYSVSTEPEVTSEASVEESATTTEEPVEEVLGASELSSSDSSAAGQGARSEIIETVIARAMSQVGQPYAWGGGTASGPSQGIRDGGVADSYGDYNKVGFDCSGLVLYAFAGAGISLPHYTGYQYQRGTRIDPSEIERGDLIFYGPSGDTHVAIYLGDGQMLEAPQSGSYVQVSPVRWAGMSPYAVRMV